MMLQLKYFILVPPTDEKISPFQGFNMDVIHEEFCSMIHFICYLPNHPLEVFMNQDALIKFRNICQPKDICALNAKLFSKEILSDRDTLYIIACPIAYISSAKEAGLGLDINPIILSTEKSVGVIDISKMVPKITSLDREIQSRIICYQKTRDIKDKLPKLRKPYKSNIGIPETGGGAILSNEIFLKALGFSFKGHTLLPAIKPDTYIDFVAKLADLTIGRSTQENTSRELILFAPGIAPYLYDVKHHFWNSILRNVKVKWHREFITNGMIRNPHYSGFIIENITRDNPLKDPIAASIILMRKRELLATNVFIALLAASKFSTPIRLPNSVNLHFSKMKQLEEFAKRGDSKAPKLLQRKFSELNECLVKVIGDDIANTVVEKSDFCTICSDMPLEWTYLGKLPLMISHEVSKISMTPGNMLLQYCAPGDGIDLPASALEKVLVIRSFKKGDRLMSLLETSIEGFPLSGRMQIQIVDVTTIDEATAALNAFDGATVIFDCHGNHAGPEGAGWLQIGSEKLNTWELAHKARVPPIVLLSACLTSAIGGSHASVANGLLRSGALSVLGTFLPVKGIDSGIFMARLIYRIDAFLPALKEMGMNMITWRTLISTFFRMSYATDVLRYFLFEEKILSKDDYMEIHLDANIMINSLRKDWFDKTIETISERTNKTESELLALIHTNSPLMETMLYCQHGRPELITIHL